VQEGEERREEEKTVDQSIGRCSGAPAGGPQGVIAQSEGAEKPFKQEELDQLVAPIALYPDSLLAQIFMASTYPLEWSWRGAGPRRTKTSREMPDSGSGEAGLGPERQVAGEFSPGAGHDE